MGILEFGGIIFWAIIGILFVAFCITLEDTEKRANLFIPTSIILIIGGGLFWFYKDHLHFEFPVLSIVLGSVIYLLLGITWSFFKWLRFVKIMYSKYIAKLVKYPNTSKSDYLPLVSSNKAQLTSWILYWPFSVSRYAFVNLLGDVVDKIILKVTGIYNNITDNIFKQNANVQD